jgi:predicted amidohydrolase YtcJ
MRRVNVAAFATTFALGVLAVFASPARAQTGVTAFEGARLIVGDGGAPIENATLLVDGARIVAAGRAADVNVPSGVTRVSLAGKTVMPMLIDTHVHLSPTREAIMRDLQQRAYFGVSAALSLGMDKLRAARYPRPDHPGLRALLQRRARHHHARTGTPDGAVLDQH